MFSHSTGSAGNRGQATENLILYIIMIGVVTVGIIVAYSSIERTISPTTITPVIRGGTEIKLLDANIIKNDDGTVTFQGYFSNNAAYPLLVEDNSVTAIIMSKSIIFPASDVTLNIGEKTLMEGTSVDAIAVNEGKSASGKITVVYYTPAGAYLTNRHTTEISFTLPVMAELTPY